MQIIKDSNDKYISKFLMPQLQEYKLDDYIPNPYIVTVRDSENYIYHYNCLTNQIIKLSQDESIDAEFAIKNWWYLPKYTDPFTTVHILKQLYREKEYYSTHLDVNQSHRSVVIFTTTACNARCGYCFEKGIKTQSMTIETANKVIDLIEQSCNVPDLVIRWFGGEPLVHYDIIKYISDKLTADGINFYSTMISNGYLFSEQMLEDIKNAKLARVQITLDGTETVYNEVKNYQNSDMNPFNTVLKNIRLLLHHGIKVKVRLNCSDTNFEEMQKLLTFLCQQEDMVNNSKFSINLAPIVSPTMSEEIIDITYENILKLHQQIVDTFPPFLMPIRYSGARVCMADATWDYTIMPDGRLITCEHLTDENFGDTEHGYNIQDLIAVNKKFNQHLDGTLEQCKTCVRFPMCFKSTNCPAHKPVCTKHMKEYQEFLLELGVISEIQQYDNQQTAVEVLE